MEKYDLLAPTLSNLYGLEVRFKACDERARITQACKNSIKSLTIIINRAKENVRCGRLDERHSSTSNTNRVTSGI